MQNINMHNTPSVRTRIAAATADEGSASTGTRPDKLSHNDLGAIWFCIGGHLYDAYDEPDPDGPALQHRSMTGFDAIAHPTGEQPYTFHCIRVDAAEYVHKVGHAVGFAEVYARGLHVLISWMMDHDLEHDPIIRQHVRGPAPRPNF